VYTIKKGERLSYLLERAGGFTDKAYLEGTIFIRQRVKELQQKSINEMVERLERELLSTGTAEVAVALSPEEAKVKETEIRQKRDFVNRLRNVTALGRISIKIDVPEKLKNTAYDIELEDNDIIEIPTNPKTVFVVGSVYNQTAFIYKDDAGVDYYLKLAGGTTENANESSIYILKSDGTAERVKSGFFGFGQVSRLMPGDTIVVPEKLERIAWMKNIKDITQILYQIAVTAGVLIVAF
ncbi:MAG: SLBB domain-containing protein, partial [Candidatus Micrarchaeota archaeon]|nr:SLBB domain-containing protein [Candidatus Micrarchaeota archaeon]